MTTAALIILSISAVFFAIGSGVWWCVLKDDPRYCIACRLWGKR